jgi:hypothetical protein
LENKDARRGEVLSVDFNKFSSTTSVFYLGLSLRGTPTPLYKSSNYLSSGMDWYVVEEQKGDFTADFGNDV